MKKVLVIVGGLVVLCIAVIAVAALAGFGLTQPTATMGDDFMTALRDADYAKAFALCTPALQQELGTADDLQNMIESNNVKPITWTFNSRSVSGNEGQLDGGITLSNNRNGSVRLTLANQDGKWQIIGFNLKEN